MTELTIEQQMIEQALSDDLPPRRWLAKYGELGEVLQKSIEPKGINADSSYSVSRRKLKEVTKLKKAALNYS